MHFLKEATIHGEADTLKTPSASIILGKPPKCGTGSFELQAHLTDGGGETAGSRGQAAAVPTSTNLSATEAAGEASDRKKKKRLNTT